MNTTTCNSSSPHIDYFAAKSAAPGDPVIGSMTTDAAEIWWSEAAREPYADDNGAWCYVNGGARHTIDSWPHEDSPVFQPPCDSASDTMGKMDEQKDSGA